MAARSRPYRAGSDSGPMIHLRTPPLTSPPFGLGQKVALRYSGELERPWPAALLLMMLLGLAIAQDGPTHAFAQDGPTHTLVKPSIVCGTIELLETFAFSSRIPEGIDCQQLGVDWRGRYSGARELKLIQG